MFLKFVFESSNLHRPLKYQDDARQRDLMSSDTNAGVSTFLAAQIALRPWADTKGRRAHMSGTVGATTTRQYLPKQT